VYQLFHFKSETSPVHKTKQNNQSILKRPAWNKSGEVAKPRIVMRFSRRLPLSRNVQYPNQIVLSILHKKVILLTKPFAFFSFSSLKIIL
jgi:hypothetical protein